MSVRCFELDQPKPAGDWIGWKAWIELAGSQYRAAEVARFALAAETAKKCGRVFEVVLHREPDNPHDRFAIAVIGRAEESDFLLGYIPREAAREIGDFPKEMPLSGRVIRVKFVNDKVFVTVQVLIPSKKWRDTCKW